MRARSRRDAVTATDRFRLADRVEMTRQGMRHHYYNCHIWPTRPPCGTVTGFIRDPQIIYIYLDGHKLPRPFYHDSWVKLRPTVEVQLDTYEPGTADAEGLPPPSRGWPEEEPAG
jgi:hypothetical protein